MNTETKDPVETEEGLALVLPPHLLENFLKADLEIRQLYGMSPGVEALIRLWTGWGTSSQIRKTFERAVLEKDDDRLGPNALSYFDDDEF